MRGTMQDTPLTLVPFFERAERLFPAQRVLTATGLEETTYGAWADRTRRLGGVLETLGLSADGRVGTFAWNTARHLELYFAAPCTGRVLHTLNIRLFPDQVVFIANHAADEVVFCDRSLAALLGPLLPELKTVRHLVLMDDGKGEVPDVPGHIDVHDYEELLAGADPIEFGVSDEWQAAAICYTSGTTGNPKGVAYSHRSCYLHTMGAMQVDSLGVCERDVILPAGVPTIWMGVLPELRGKDTSSLRSVVCGGSAVPKALSEGYREAIGLPITQAWGMTETNPIASVVHVKSTLDHLDEAAKADVRATVGIVVPGVEFRVVDPESTTMLPWDGRTSGELQVRGPWIASEYYADDRRDAFTADGWLGTGDVATVDPEGYIRLVDRTKDLIKSGGEWISSVDIENELMGHPKVVEAAVIGVPSQKWSERPVACVVVKRGETLTKDEVLDYLRPKVAKWQVPDDVVFIEEVPKTSVGKFSKKTLRERFADLVLP